MFKDCHLQIVDLSGNHVSRLFPSRVAALPQCSEDPGPLRSTQAAIFVAVQRLLSTTNFKGVYRPGGDPMLISGVHGAAFQLVRILSRRFSQYLLLPRPRTLRMATLAKRDKHSLGRSMQDDALPFER